jgi:hypothetical protein
MHLQILRAARSARQDDRLARRFAKRGRGA